MALRVNADDLLAFFERRVEPRVDAADLLAETMLQAWRRKDATPASATEARMWLFGIARNVLSNHARGKRRRLALGDRLRANLQPPETTPESAVTVRNAIARLRPDQRELVMLVHWEGFNLAEAAAILGINPSTARSRHAVAKEELRTLLTSTHDATTRA